MRNLTGCLAFLLIMPLLAGCPQMANLRLGQDRPEDMQQLLDQDEYARARQLTRTYPAVATPDMQVAITTLESSYENRIFTDARKLADKQDLRAAIDLLTEASHKIPDSTLLREYRHQLEQERTRQLENNERRQLVARAHYILNEQELSRQQANLQSPSLEQRWRNARNRNESLKLARQLLEHGQIAVQRDELKTASECLELSQALNDTDDAQSVLVELQSKEAAQKTVARKKQATRNKKIRIGQNQETRNLLVKTRKALDENDLEEARQSFDRIPSVTSNDSKVTAIQAELDQAVDVKVTKLIVQGDAQYRADRVNEAIRTWSEANTLDPDNSKVNERLDRANKVLARLEELRSKQKK